MKIRVSTEALNEALSVSSIVSPSAATPQKENSTGYLFVVKDGVCSIHGRDDTHRVRVNVPVIESEGDGSFIYPSLAAEGLKFLDGWIDIEYGHDEKEDRFWIKYETEGGANANVSSFDPRLMKTVDDEISEDTYKVPPAILKDALACVNAHVAKKDTVPEVYKTLQLFDSTLKGGDGTMFGADNIRSCYYFSEGLCGRAFAISTKDVGLVTSFLSKCGNEDVTVHMGPIRFIVAPNGSAVGWSSTVEEHKKFKYYALKNDGYVLAIPKVTLVRAFKHVSSSGSDKIRIKYDAEHKMLQLHAVGRAGPVTSAPVGANPVVSDTDDFGGDASDKDFAASIGTEHLRGLIEPVRGNAVILRVAVIPATANRSEMTLLRTVEEYHLNRDGKVVIPDDDNKEGVFLCRVTRYAPSMG